MVSEEASPWVGDVVVAEMLDWNDGVLLSSVMEEVRGTCLH